MKNEDKVRLCKKCQKPLPMNYKQKCCQACMNKDADKMKKGIKALKNWAGPMLGLIVTFVAHEKINSKK